MRHQKKLLGCLKVQEEPRHQIQKAQPEPAETPRSQQVARETSIELTPVKEREASTAPPIFALFGEVNEAKETAKKETKQKIERILRRMQRAKKF